MCSPISRNYILELYGVYYYKSTRNEPSASEPILLHANANLTSEKPKTWILQSPESEFGPDFQLCITI